jgi:excisionase family DNA binding protein
MITMTKEFLDIQDLSECLSIKRSTLYVKVESGEIPHYKVGRLIRFKKSDLDAWIESHRRERIDLDKKAKEILKTTTRPGIDIDNLVKKSIEESKKRRYNSFHGKPDRIRGLRKEVENGSI